MAKQRDGMMFFNLDTGSGRSLKDVERLLETFGEGVAPAIARALNRATTGIPTDAGRAVKEGYGVKAADTKAAFRHPKLAAPKSLRTEIYARGNVFGLYKFGARPKMPTTHTTDGKSGRPSPKRGISVRVTTRAQLPGTFVAAMSSGHTGVFSRGGDGTLYELYGPSIPQMLGTLVEKDDDLLDRGFDERFATRLDHEVMRFLKDF